MRTSATILNAHSAVSAQMIDFLPEILLVFAGVAGFLGLFYSASRTFLETYSGAIGIVFAVIAGVYVLKEHQISVKNERLA